MGSILDRTTHPTAGDHVAVSRPTANGTAKIGNGISHSSGSQYGHLHSAATSETGTNLRYRHQDHRAQPRKDSAESIRRAKQADNENDVSETVATSTGVDCASATSRTASGVITCTVTITHSHVSNPVLHAAVDEGKHTLVANSQDSTATSDSKPHRRDQKELQAKAAVNNGEDTLVTNYQDSTSASCDSKPHHHRDQGPRITEDAAVIETDIVTSEHEIGVTHHAPANGTSRDFTATSDSANPVCDNLISSLSEVSLSPSPSKQDPTADSCITNHDKEAEAAPSCDSKAAGSQNSQTASERQSTSESPKTTEQSNPENPTPSSKLSDSDSSSLEDLDAPSGFRTVKVKDFVFTVLKRYKELKCIGSGAQGIVW